MNTNYLSSAQLKERSKKQLEGKFGIAIGMLVIIQIASVLLSRFIGVLIPAYTLPTLVIQLCVTFITSAVFGVFQIGLTLFYLKTACGQESGFSDLLFGYQNHFEKSLMLSLVITGISFIGQVVTNIPMWAMRMTGSLSYLFWILPLGILSLVITTYFSLLFSQVCFLLLDFPSYTAGDIFKLSCKVMTGHKGRLLYITLSFLPLMLLSLLTCGIGLLWVLPYRNMVMANFYLNLMNPKRQ